VSDPLAWIGPWPLITYLGIAAVLSWFIRRNSVEETLKHPVAFGAYAGWTLISTIFLTPLALLTLDSTDWGTRAKQENQKTQERDVLLGNPSP
jgi:hypothetical protein